MYNVSYLISSYFISFHAISIYKKFDESVRSCNVSSLYQVAIEMCRLDQVAIEMRH